MDKELFIQMAPVIATAAIGILGFLIRAYFNKIHDDIALLRNELARNDGKLDPLQADLRENTIELIKLRSEINAMWRFIDNANQRATDGGDNGFDHR